jgi:hypothetical protein
MKFPIFCRESSPMFDFSLPPATAVLPIDVHDFLVPNAPTNHFGISLNTIAQANIFPQENPPPPPQ